MKCSLGISNFLEEISSLSHSIVFLYSLALITKEGFLISPCYSLELCIQRGISFLFSFAFSFSSFCCISKLHCRKGGNTQQAKAEYHPDSLKVLVAQLSPTLCNPMDCSLRGSSVHGILQARTGEWVVILFSRGSSQPRDQTQVPCIAGRFFTIWATREAPNVTLMNGFGRKL